MMAINRHTEYAVRIVLHLSAAGEGTLVSIPEIAAARRLPVPFVRRVVSRLAEVGVLRTVRGSRGGASLGRPAARITLFDVVSAMEGSPCPSPCVERPQDCHFGDSCPVRGVWTKAARVLEDHLRTVSFSELAVASGRREVKSRARTARGSAGRESKPSSRKDPSWIH